MSRKLPPPEPIIKRGPSANDNAIDDEQALLASLGSTLQNTTTYEADVLRTAEHDSVPNLTGIGFPADMSKSLVHPALPNNKSSALSQVSNMQAVLGRLRSQDLSQKPHNLKFLLKQQMLLNLLHTTTHDTELCVRPKEEAVLEQERRKRFRKQSIRKQTSSDLGNLIDPPRKKRSSVNDKNIINKKLKASSDNNVPPKSVLKKSTYGGTAEDASALKQSLGERLEDIKKGNKSVTFGEPSSSSSSISGNKKIIKRRVGIQARKKQRRGGNDDGQTSASKSNTKDNEMDEQEFQKRKQHLLKLRKERELRRKERRQQWMTSTSRRRRGSGSSSRSSKKEGDSSDEGEKELDDDDITRVTESGNDIKKEDQSAIVDSTNPLEPVGSIGEDATTTTTPASVPAEEKESAVNVASEDPADTSTIAVTTYPITITAQCPLCRQEIQADSQAMIDEAIAEHMHICGNSRTRGQRRSTRTRSQVCYAEADDDNNNMEEEEDDSVGIPDAPPPKNSKIAASSRKKPPMSKNTDDDDDEVGMVDNIDNENEDEELQVDDIDEEPISDDDYDKSEGKSFGSPSSSRIHRPTTIDDWDEDEYEDRVDEWIESGIANMKVMKERDVNETPPGEDIYDGGLVIPAWINDRLFPYQRTGLQWMWELHRQQAGGIIGDEMGLGKTVQICAYLGSLASSRKTKSILIIAPTTLLQHWLKELSTWAPGLRRILIHQSADDSRDSGPSRSNVSPYLFQGLDKWLKTSRKSRLFEAIDEEDLETRDPASFCGTGYVCVTTYENIRRNPETWINHNWSYIVMDEAQKIRNPDADITLVCKRLRTPHRLALSGTPIQNDLRELWSLFDFVFPGRLGTLPAFEHEFADPIKRGGYSNASPMQVQLAFRCSLILRDLINPYLLRRLKKDIKEVNRMPGKKEQVLFCRLSDRQRIMYESFLQSDQVKGVLRGSIQLLGAITMLRKICNHPDLVCPPDTSSLENFVHNGRFNEDDLRDMSDDEDSVSEETSLAERSGKLEVLAKILPLWKEQGHRVLIFCQWTKMLNIIEHFVELQGWKFGRLDGKTNPATRQQLVDNFNSDDSYYGMLCTTRTGGVGLNLTGADRIVLYDPDWNPQTDAQARERAWRFGQEREVTVYRLIVAGTVEEKIYQRQIFKTALSNRILADPRQRRLFSQRDLKDLFTLRADSGSVVTGGDGSTETSELTNGDGYVNPDETQEEEEDKPSSNDDGETMREIFQSKGLAGVFDHDIVEKNDVAKKTSVREMEAKAKKIAREALQAIENSVEESGGMFTPTYTGSAETGRFGGGNASDGSSSLSGARRLSAGINGSDEKASSSTLLASIRTRDEEVKSLGKFDKQNPKSTQHYTELLKRIKSFVRRQAPTSDEILDEFSNVPDYDAAVFKRLLKSVAVVEKRTGRWRLQER